MAIKVGTQTVIDDSRNITNIATATATSFVGDGSGLTNLPVSDAGLYEATASGSITNGAPVIVNSDGTVSAVVGTGTSQFIGPSYTIDSSLTSPSDINIAYNDTTDRFVVTYKGQNSYLYVVTGTSNGYQLTFGTPVVFYSGNGYCGHNGICSDPHTNRFFIAYRNKNAGTTAMIYTIKGEIGTDGSISLGSATRSDSNSYCGGFGIGFHSNSSSIVVAYESFNMMRVRVYGVNTDGSFQHRADSQFDTTDYRYSYSDFTIGAESGRKVMIIYNTTYNDGYSNYNRGKAVYFHAESSGQVDVSNISSTKVLWASDGASDLKAIQTGYTSNYATVTVAYQRYTLSPNRKYGPSLITLRLPSQTTANNESIEIGPSVQLESTYYCRTIGIAEIVGGGYTAGSFVVGWENGNVLKLRTGMQGGSGNVDINSINFTSDTIVTPYKTGTESVSLAFDWYSDPDVILVAYPWFSYPTADNTYGPNVFAFQFESINSTLTETNYIGISSGSYSNGQTANIHIIGALNEAQSNLTPGLEYYVQRDGSLDPIPDIPSVLAGTAVASNKILVKQ